MLIDPVRARRGERDAARRKLDEQISNLAMLEAGHASLSDFDAIVTNMVAIDRAKDLVSAARQALDFKEAELAAAEVEQQRKDDDARHAALKREALAGKKRVSALLAKLQALAPELKWLAAHRAEIRDYNTSLKGTAREPIVDAETLARCPPSVTIPAQYREDSGWYDAKTGERPTFLKRDGDGKMVPASQGNWRYEQRRTEVSPERVEPGALPKTLASAVGLARAVGVPV